MVGAFVTFIVLYGLLYCFERGRTEVDGFSIATVAGAPVLLVFLVSVSLSFLYPHPVALAVLPLATLLITTFLLLFKLMELSAGRSAAYTVVVLIVNIGISFVLIGA